MRIRLSSNFNNLYLNFKYLTYYLRRLSNIIIFFMTNFIEFQRKNFEKAYEKI